MEERERFYSFILSRSDTTHEDNKEVDEEALSAIAEIKQLLGRHIIQKCLNFLHLTEN
jgi:hypothetical protein